MNGLTERTSRAIVGMTWACAGIVMVTSAGNAVLTFGALGGNRAIGLGLGIAVDVALCVGLIGDRRLAANGLTSTWGRVLRIIAAAMSVVLNVGAAMIDGHYFLAVLHAFLPVLLVVLTEYGQDVLLKFTDLAREGQRDEHAEAMAAVRRERDDVATQLHDTRQALTTERDTATRARQKAELVARQNHDTWARQMTELTAQLDTERDNVATARQALRDARHDTTHDNQRDTTRQTSRDNGHDTGASTPDQRRAWVRQQLTDGQGVTGADVQQQFPGSKDGARIVKQVKAETPAPPLRSVATGGK